MLQPFTTCFTFLHRRIKFFPNQPRIKDMMTSKRKQPDKKLCPNYDLSTSFLHMELSTQFQQVFKLIDTNGDGKISATELSEVLSCLGYNKCMAAKEAEGMVRVLDFNGDGFVDFDEFMVVMEEENFGSDMENDDDDHYHDDRCLMDAFLVFDTDKNGLISAKELQTVLLNLGCDDCSLRDCKRMIKGVDKNGDGFVDFGEFRCMMQNGLGK